VVVGVDEWRDALSLKLGLSGNCGRAKGRLFGEKEKKRHEWWSEGNRAGLGGVMIDLTTPDNRICVRLASAAR
jgi:hypothetical protein